MEYDEKVRRAGAKITRLQYDLAQFDESHAGRDLLPSAAYVRDNIARSLNAAERYLRELLNVRSAF